LKQIAIIGAGVSGLSAAIKLAESADVSITIFEARQTPGGRTRSWIDNETGDTLDNGQHLLMGCYTVTLEYMKAIGTFGKFTSSVELEIPFSTLSDNASLGEKSSKTVRSLALPAPFHLAGLFLSGHFTLREKFALARFGYFAKFKHANTAWTCADLFVATNQPETLIRKFWEPLILATLNAPVAVASAEILLNVFRIAFLADRKSSALLFPTVGLSELLIIPAVDLLLGKGHHILLGEPVSSIRMQGDSLVITSGNGSEVREFDAVILAAPMDKKIELPQAIEELYPFESSPIVNAYFWFDKPILDSPIRAFIGTTLQWAFAKKTNFGGQRVALTVSAADAIIDKSADEIEAILLNDLRITLPAASTVKLLRSQIIKEKRATVLFTPNSQKARPNTKTKISGFYLAGDTVQNGLPATIEGAIRNGQAAATLAAIEILGII
jgi:squalene-associated FAD-dependent desaturase